MSEHLHEDRLMALRDGAASADAAGRAHLTSCADCGAALERLRERASVVSAALGALDTELAGAAEWDVEAARTKVRERVAGAAAARTGTPSVLGRRSRRGMASLSRAAGLLLVTAAAASALPGSPVRRWLSDRAGGSDAAVATPAAAPTPAEGTPTALAAETTGVRLSVPGGPLRVVLQDLAPGTELRVALVAGTEAAVYAPAGSRFTSAEGRVEARVTPGDVRVELPRGVDPVSLEVGGRMYLRSTAAGLDLPGPVASRTDDEILFRIPR